jgi:archaellum component FlaG (FlaF/FlaG flagellin family)
VGAVNRIITIKIMHKIFVFLVFLYSLVVPAQADDRLGGRMRFRGSIDGNNFIGQDFSIMTEDEKIVITNSNGTHKFSINIKNEVINDAVISPGGNSVAVLIVPKDKNKPTARLVVVNSLGNTNTYSYKTHHMTETLGWIEELGSVSNDGRYILIKSATLNPPNGNKRIVNHQWLIIKFDNNLIEVVEKSNAFARWGKYLP